MEIPTQFSYETNSESFGTIEENQESPDLLFDVDDFSGVRKKKFENIFDEVEKIRRKETEKEINYIDSLIISDQEFEKSSQDMIHITEMMTEEHIVEMISTRKLFFVYKHILEIFAILIGEEYFEWSHFRSKLNIHEIRYRMINCNLGKFNRGRVNYFLNKIYKNKKLSDEYLKNNSSGIGIIFKWIKAALKVCLFKLQNRKTEENISSKNFTTEKMMKKSTKSKNINNGTFNSKNMGKTAPLNHPMNNFVLTNYKEFPQEEELEKTGKMPENINNNKGGGFYLTSLGIPNDKNTKLPNIMNLENIKIINQDAYRTDSTIKELTYENLPNTENTIKRTIPIIKRSVNNKEVFSDFMQNLHKEAYYNRDKNKPSKIQNYNISSLPLLKFKTYHQLKRFFKNDYPKNSKKLNESGSGLYGNNSEVEKFSLRNPKNSGKIINMLALGKMKGISSETFDIFLENMKMEDYFKENETSSKII